MTLLIMLGPDFKEASDDHHQPVVANSTAPFIKGQYIRAFIAPLACIKKKGSGNMRYKFHCLIAS